MKSHPQRCLPLIAAVALFMLTLVACGARSSTEQRDAIGSSTLGAGPLLPVDAAGPDFFYEQQITVRWPDGEREFSAVLQKVEDTLSVVALSPMGQPAFRIQLRDGEVTMEAFTDRTLPFPPEYIVADVQKSFFRWLEQPDEGFSGEQYGTYNELDIEEHFESGTLTTRAFARSDAPDAGQVVVSYRYDEREPLPAVEIVNSWFNYTLNVTTTRVRSL